MDWSQIFQSLVLLVSGAAISLISHVVVQYFKERQELRQEARKKRNSRLEELVDILGHISGISFGLRKIANYSSEEAKSEIIGDYYRKGAEIHRFSDLRLRYPSLRKAMDKVLEEHNNMTAAVHDINTVDTAMLAEIGQRFDATFDTLLLEINEIKRQLD